MDSKLAFLPLFTSVLKKIMVSKKTDLFINSMYGGVNPSSYPLPIKTEINQVQKFIHWETTNEAPNFMHGVKARDFWKLNWFLEVFILKNEKQSKCM